MVSESPVQIKSFLLGERIDTKNLSIDGHTLLLQTPRVLRDREGGLVAVFRFGALVIARAAASSPQDVAPEIRKCVINPFDQVETETLSVTLGDPGDSRLKQEDRFVMADLSPERFAVAANALAKSVALAHDEQRIHSVFEKLEPFARDLARSGGRAVRAAASLRLLGDALLAQQRMVGRVEVHEKPEILWERPDLVRLHARLDEEYELTERARELSRKLKVIEETARAIAEVADAHISRRLEIAIVVLILLEIVLSLFGFFSGRH